jgi:hypothetical protein
MLVAMKEREGQDYLPEMVILSPVNESGLALQETVFS